MWGRRWQHSHKPRLRRSRDGEGWLFAVGRAGEPPAQHLTRTVFSPPERNVLQCALLCEEALPACLAFETGRGFGS